MKRMALITSELALTNGWGRFSLRMAESLAKRADVVMVTTVAAASQLPSNVNFPVRTVDNFSAPHTKNSFWNVCRTLPERALVKDCDFVYCLMEPLIPLCSALSGRKKRLIIAGVGTYLTRPIGSHTKEYTSYYQRAHRIICISRYTRSRLLAALPQLQNTRVAPLGIERSFIRAPFVLHSKSTPRFVSIGSIKARKGHHVLARSFHQVLQTYPDATWEIIGHINERTDYTSDLKDTINTLGIASQVTFSGMQSERYVIEALDSATMHCLPSVNSGDAYEGFGLVHLEANARGTITLGSLDCGNEDAIHNGVSGYLVPQNDSSAIASKMLEAIEDPDKRQAMEHSACKFASKMGWDRTAATVCEQLDIDST